MAHLGALGATSAREAAGPQLPPGVPPVTHLMALTASESGPALQCRLPGGRWVAGRAQGLEPGNVS